MLLLGGACLFFFLGPVVAASDAHHQQPGSGALCQARGVSAEWSTPRDAKKVAHSHLIGGVGVTLN